MTTNNAEFELDNVFNVRGRVAIITGGGSGLGLMAAQALAVNGSKVYIIGRTAAKLQRVVDVHGQNIHGSILPLVGDISKKDEIRRLVREIELRESHVDILINNAGIYSNRQKPEGSNAEEVKKNLFDAENATFENWKDIYATNVAAIYFMTTAFLPLLQKGSDARRPKVTSTVINISSINGLIKESLSRFASNSAKAATIHLTKMLAVEIANCKLNIRVNSIAPGLFPSEITAGVSDNSQKSTLPAGTCSEISAQRPGNDVDMAGAILFASTCEYINGQIIAVDGGYLVKYGKL